MNAAHNPSSFANPQEIAKACRGALPAAAEKGVELFNAGEYWLAHEALEAAWLAEPGPARHLYKGILQAGVAYLHVQRGNFIGLVKMYERSRVWLAPWPPICRTLDIGQLRQDIAAVVAAAGRLGPARLAEFDPALLKPLRRV
ncbi:MAG: DUF309 domain-containing protein [Anaerolineae bacterium]|nr:DUF309 domain-containing protein [Anaerolineae bacterium]